MQTEELLKYLKNDLEKLESQMKTSIMQKAMYARKIEKLRIEKQHTNQNIKLANEELTNIDTELKEVHEIIENKEEMKKKLFLYLIFVNIHRSNYLFFH